MDRKELIQSPLLFQDNRIKRFYLGGSVMNEWRRMPKAEDSNQCEELLITSMGAISKGEASGFGVSRTIPEQGGILLSELIQEYPDEILGREFQKYNPNQLSVLARAGDTKVRLVMQCHPRKADAQKYFHMPMGKTEAWYIARVREAEGEPACVRAGFKEGVTRAQWKELIEKQDIDGMLACLHTIEVKKGDTVLIPAGTPHCAGPNCLFVEFHECNDITVRTEKSINGMTISEEEMFYGLPLEEALNLFDYTTYSEAEVREKLGMRPKEKEKGGEYSLCEMIGPENNISRIPATAFHGKSLYWERVSSVTTLTSSPMCIAVRPKARLSNSFSRKACRSVFPSNSMPTDISEIIFCIVILSLCDII